MPSNGLIPMNAEKELDVLYENCAKNTDTLAAFCVLRELLTVLKQEVSKEEQYVNSVRRKTPTLLRR